MSDARILIDRILQNPGSSEVGDLANELLGEFHRGLKLEYLSALLGSSDDQVVEAAAFIASELGHKAKPLLSEIVPLLSHRSKRVRFDLLDCILVCTKGNAGPGMATALNLLHDPESSVRWKAMQTMSMASEEQLNTALKYATAVSGTKYVAGLEWLISPQGIDSKVVTAELNSPDETMRKFAAIAAARMAKKDPIPLRHATSNAEAEIKKFAETALHLSSTSQ